MTDEQVRKKLERMIAIGNELDAEAKRRGYTQPLYDTEMISTPATSSLVYFLDPTVELMRKKLKPGRFKKWLWRYNRKLKRQERRFWRGMPHLAAEDFYDGKVACY